MGYRRDVTWYEFLLYVHISMAVIWVGGGFASQFFALRALRATDPTRLASFAADVEWVGTRIFAPASGLAFVSGIWLVLDSDFWGFGDDWIVIALVLFAVTFLAGMLFFGPESGRISKLVAAEGADSPAAQARIQRILAITRADLVLLFLIVFDMAVKPSFDDVWLYVAILVAAGVAAVLVRNGLRARPAAASTPAPHSPA
jgi:uncharacterized membrane protein